MKKIIKLILLILVLVFVIAACKKQANDNEENLAENDNTANNEENSDLEENEIKPIDLYKELSVYNIESERKDKHLPYVTEFDLGDREYTTNAGVNMPYKIRGVIGLPQEEGKYPLILISHGSHENIDVTKRFDTGFTYLVEELARNGFIAVSMDMSMAYIWKYGDNQEDEKSIPIAKDHIMNLILASLGEDLAYGVDLKDKIDFNNVGLIGHSRGGEIIYKIATDLAQDEELNNVLFKSFLSIAPTYFFDREWPNADAAIIVPEYDGDVTSLDGYTTFKALNDNSEGSHVVTLLRKGNHNYFNSNIERNDALMLSSQLDISDQLTREKQEEFLINYCIDFFDKSLFDKPIANKMYGLDVESMYKLANSLLLIDANSVSNLKPDKAFIESKIDSWFYKYDEIIIDTITSGSELYTKKPLINIRWEEESEVSILPQETDFSKFNKININLVMDLADDLNQKDKPFTFSILLSDNKDNKTTITLASNLNALEYGLGEMETTYIEDLEVKYWSSLSPIAGIDIPLNEFDNIDLKNIKDFALIFDKTSSGSLYIESIYLQ